MSAETEDKDRGYTPWHAGFRNALQITFEPYGDVLKCMFEYQLTTEALRPDVIIIKKRLSVFIDND
ncbi:MAG: hypothetical protein LBS86_06565, partial [Treponema sp.]|nr:hypothetical protein [Treponema sp.]